jgi:hypothetical protein
MLIQSLGFRSSSPGAEVVSRSPGFVSSAGGNETKAGFYEISQGTEQGEASSMAGQNIEVWPVRAREPDRLARAPLAG